MKRAEYERKFADLVSELGSARRAYENANEREKDLRLHELTCVKDRLLTLTRDRKSYTSSPLYIPEVPNNEEQRLQALRQLQILDSPYETLFDEITLLASHICETPIALISFVDEDRQWFKANVGLEGVTQTARDIAFCAHTIMGNCVVEIPDATQDVRFADNPLVIDEPSIRFYAAAPITLPLGENIGTICVIDHKAHYLTEHQRKTLTILANIISKALVAREVGKTSYENLHSIKLK